MNPGLDLDLAAQFALPRSTPREVVAKVAHSRTFLLLIFDGALFGAIWAVQPGFGTPANLHVLIDSMALQAIVAAAMTALLAAGRFDLSVDGVAALCGVVAGKLMASTGVPFVAALIIGLIAGAAIGLVQGLAVERYRLNSVVVSLALWWLTAGVAFGLVETSVPGSFPQEFQDLGQLRIGGFLIYDYYALVLVPIMGIGLAYTKFGYHVFATGGNRESARLKGLKVEHIGIILYMAVSTTAALAGIIFSARVDSAQPDSLNGTALNVIAAAVIGGASLEGGSASIAGAMLGLFLLNMLDNASIFLGISPLWQEAISGAVLAAAVVSSRVSDRRLGREATDSEEDDLDEPQVTAHQALYLANEPSLSGTHEEPEEE